jgi:hypothetical protein
MKLLRQTAHERAIKQKNAQFLPKKNPSALIEWIEIYLLSY